MLLALDVGNTNTTLGLYKLDGDKPELAAHWRVTSHRTQTVDEYGVIFVNLFELHGMSPSQVEHIIIASVVPPVDSTLRQVCEIYFHVEPMFVEPGIKTGMKMLIDNSRSQGAWRLSDRLRQRRLARHLPGERFHLRCAERKDHAAACRALS